MTTTELEQVILEHILNIYNKKYTGKIKVQKLDPVGYRVELGLSTPEKPLVIYAELPDEQFIKFFKKELKTKRFNLTYYGKLYSVYPYDCNPMSRNCNDKG